MYDDLLEIPSVKNATIEEPQANPTEEDDAHVLQSTAIRLLQQDTGNSPEVSTSLADHLLRRRGSSEAVEALFDLTPTTSNHATTSETLATLKAITARLDVLYTGLEGLQSFTSQQPSLPLGIMVEKEWSALVRACVSEGFFGRVSNID